MQTYTCTYLSDEEATVCSSTNVIFCLLLWNTGESSSDNDDTVDIFELEREVIPVLSNTSELTGKSEIHNEIW